jgi:hypothetical protein
LPTQVEWPTLTGPASAGPAAPKAARASALAIGARLDFHVTVIVPSVVAACRHPAVGGLMPKRSGGALRTGFGVVPRFSCVRAPRIPLRRRQHPVADGWMLFFGIKLVN